jgi:hypothetical protein
MNALMEKVWSGGDTLMQGQQPAAPVHQLAVSLAPTIVPPPQTPVAAAAQAGPQNANQVMMTQSKRGCGKWNVKSKELTNMKNSQFFRESHARH